MDEQRPAGRLAAWLPIVGCMLTMTMVAGMTSTGLGVLVPQWVQAFSVSSGEIMLVLAGVAILTGVFGLGVGNLAGRFPPRLILLAGVGFAVVALLVGSRAPTFPFLLFAMAPLAGAANALTGPVVGQDLAVRSFARPGLAIGVVSMGFGFSGMVGPLLLATLLKQGDWRWTMTAAAGVVAVLGGLTVIAFLREPRPSPAAESAKAEATAAAPGAKASTLRILISPAFVGAAMFMLPLMGLMAGSFFHLGLYFGELGADVTAAAGLMAVSSLVGFVGTFLAGWLVDRTPHVLLQIVCLSLMGAALALLAFEPGVTAITLAVMLLSAGNSILFPVVPASFARRFTGSEFRQAISLLQPVLFSTILGAVVVGFVRDNSASYQQAFERLLLPVLAISAAGIVLMFVGRGPRVKT